MIDPRRWQAEPFVYDRIDENLTVVRDDLLEGGSKLRFLPYLVGDVREVVYGGPFCGGAALALSVMTKHGGPRATLFYAKRAELHARQRLALANGATIYQVSPGYLTNVQAKARRYAERVGAPFLPLGFDVPTAEDFYIEAIARVRAELGQPDEIWCATGSGMLARCLGRAFPDSAVRGVAVGLASRHDAQTFSPNVELIPSGYKFERETKATAPFPCCPNYDRKAWEICVRERRGRALFWNVLG